MITTSTPKVPPANKTPFCAALPATMVSIFACSDALQAGRGPSLS
jgi:hypothetical protein